MPGFNYGTTLAERVRGLIRQRYDGNVLEASRASGVPNATLSRIADGTVETPRAGALRTIAEHFDVSIDWLLSGQGKGPPDLPMSYPWRELYEWGRRVETLGLSGPLSDAMLQLPLVPFTVAGLWPGGSTEPGTDGALRQEVNEAVQHFARGWIALLDEWEQAAGLRGMNETLRREPVAVAVGFSGLAIALCESSKDIRERCIERLQKTSPLAGGNQGYGFKLLDAAHRLEGQLKPRALEASTLPPARKGKRPERY